MRVGHWRHSVTSGTANTVFPYWDVAMVTAKGADCKQRPLGSYEGKEIAAEIPEYLKIIYRSQNYARTQLGNYKYTLISGVTTVKYRSD